MTWMEPISGGSLDYLSPNPKDVRLKDLAHSLARQNRFVGHTAYSYSPAEHSLWVWKLVSLSHPHDYMLQLHAVLHDAGEAYVGDVSAPLKEAMRILSKSTRSVFDKIEHVVQRTVLIRFGIPGPDERTTAIVKVADLTMRATERACPALRPNSSERRWSTDELPPHAGLLDGTVFMEPSEMMLVGVSSTLPARVRFPAQVGLQPPPGSASPPILRISESDVSELFLRVTERLLHLTASQRGPELT